MRRLLMPLAMLLVLAGCASDEAMGTSTTRPSSATTSAKSSTATETRASAVTVPAGMDTKTEEELPPEGRETLALIDAGGPFPYKQDGAVFQNREKLLPARPAGYYHEYTVETPGSADRGTRRLITGGEGELYYTDDHYDSFTFVVRS